MVSEWENKWEALTPWPTEADLCELVSVVCHDMGKPVPRIEFRRSGHSWCWYERKLLQLPELDWVLEYRALEHPLHYRLLALHETAHWLLGPGQGHSVKFYELLFGLCETYEVPLDLALQDERAYKPRNAPKGFKAYLAGKSSESTAA
jgi:hypothetical protein